MIYPVNASSAATRSLVGIRRALACAVTAALVGLMAVPVLAQAPSTAKRGDASTKKTVTQSGPGKMNKMSKMSKDKMMAPSRVVLVFPTDGKGGVSDQISD